MLPELAARPFEPADAATLAHWFPDLAAATTWAGPAALFPVDAAQLARMHADPVRTLWTVTRAGRIAGHFQLAHDRRCRLVRLGRVALAPELRGQGLARELVRLAVDLAFGGDPDLHRIELHVYENNIAARAAYTKAGFQLEGVLRENIPVGDELWSTAVMALLRREWLRRPA
ncbi:MAG: GNAT family protein [Acetobacteraceae bacterium]